MKCTNCGSSKLVKVSFPLQLVMVEGEQYVAPTETYLCSECGHYEFFSKEIAEKAKELLPSMEKCNQAISEIKKTISQENSSFDENKVKIEEEISSLSVKSKSLDITVREKNDIDSKLIELKKKLKNIQVSHDSLVKET